MRLALIVVAAWAAGAAANATPPPAKAFPLDTCNYAREVQRPPNDNTPKPTDDEIIEACTNALAYAYRDHELYSAIYNNRGLAYTRKNEFIKAIDDFNLSIHHNADDERLYLNRGLAYFYLGEYKEAIQDYSTSLRFSPQFAAAMVARGDVYFKLRDPQRALQDYDHAIQLYPKYAGARTNRCLARAELGRDLDGALADCNVAIQYKPVAPYALSYRAIIKYRRGDVAGASEDLAAALAEKPRFTYALYLRGLIKRSQGDAAGAKLDLDAAGPETTAELEAAGLR